MILNLKELNKSIEKHLFKMDTLSTALTLVKPNCFMALADFKDVYYTITVAPRFRLYLQFEWGGKVM